MRTASGQNIRWSYMEHWKTMSPRGPVGAFSSHREADRFVKAIAAVGFTGLDVFDFNLGTLTALFGSLEGFNGFLQERGIDKVAGVFHAPSPYLDLSIGAPHIRESHDRLFARCREIVQQAEPLEAETFIVMPAASYRYCEPVTDDQVKAAAELWNRVGEMTLQHGMRTAGHHEFWCGIRSAEEVARFYEETDPRYVFFCVDTAHHAIVGDDPVELFRRHADRVCALHFKDTHVVDTAGEYRSIPDAELIAPSVERWFWEMGTPEGLVDFEGMMAALREFGYQGWITVEHDKAEIGGGTYSESTAVSMWYAKNVLERIYA